jgi:beta-glucosidase
MCSYNRLNQTYACENSELLNGILKDELGFQGYVVSDWFATHCGAKSINAGLDVTIPGAVNQSSVGTGETYFGKHIVEAVNNGSVSTARLDDMVCRLTTPYFFLGQDKEYPTVDLSSIFVLGAQYGVSFGADATTRDVRGNHVALIRKLGAAGTLLLKNVNSTLPLQSPKEYCVFGNGALDPTDGFTISTRGDAVLDQLGFDIGILDIGGGSGIGGHSYAVSPLDAIKPKAQKIGARVQYITSNAILAANDFRRIYPTPEICIVLLKTFTSEGFGRTSFENDWNSTLVVNNVAKKCPKTIVVTDSWGVNTMPWANNPNVTAILVAHYPGQETGNSIADILWGDINPSGKFPYTIPANELDCDIPIVNLTDVTRADEW